MLICHRVISSPVFFAARVNRIIHPPPLPSPSRQKIVSSVLTFPHLIAVDKNLKIRLRPGTFQLALNEKYLEFRSCDDAAIQVQNISASLFMSLTSFSSH